MPKIIIFISLFFLCACNFNSKANQTSCNDNDNDNYGTGKTCKGLDCNDNDPDNWISCSKCVDNDNDKNYTGCDRYSQKKGPDCNDNNLNCSIDCTDEDNDSYCKSQDCDEQSSVCNSDCSDQNKNSASDCLETIWLKTVDYKFGNKILWTGGRIKLIQTNDKNFIGFGEVHFDPRRKICSLLIKFDRFGKIIWSKRIGLKKITFDKGFQYISPDNIFEINGSLFVSIVSKLEDNRIIKLTPDGEIEWQKKLQINKSSFSGDFIKTDNKIIFKGYCSNCFPDKNDSYRIVSLSQDATIEWEKSFSGKNKEFHNIHVFNNGFIVRKNSSAIISSIDEYGNISWQKMIKSLLIFPDLYFYPDILIRTSDNGIIYGGGLAEGSKGIFIAKFDKTGNVLWRKAIGGISNPILFDISETDDKSLLIAGGTGTLNYPFYSNKNPFGKVWLIKLDSNIQKITFEKESRNNFNRYKNIATSLFEASDNSIDFSGFYNNKILIGRLNDNGTLNNSTVPFEDASNKIYELTEEESFLVVDVQPSEAIKLVDSKSVTVVNTDDIELYDLEKENSSITLEDVIVLKNAHR